jgi:hypothetical protein
VGISVVPVDSQLLDALLFEGGGDIKIVDAWFDPVISCVMFRIAGGQVPDSAKSTVLVTDQRRIVEIKPVDA